MKIALLSPYVNIFAIGERVLSAALKQHGHDVHLVFMPRSNRQYYSSRELDDVASHLRSYDLVGLSLMTNYFDNSVQLSQGIRQRTNVPIAWGGIHPSVRPEESLAYADMVCLGEGDESFPDLANRMQAGTDWSSTPGFWFRRREEIIRNPLRPPPEDLDALPNPDMDWRTHFVWTGRKLEQMDLALMEEHYRDTYVAIATRGCPFTCTYCCHSALRLGTDGSPKVRRRGMDRLIGELVDARQRMPFLRRIKLNDDAFFTYPEADIETFARRYRDEVGLPLVAAGANPHYVTRTKLAALADAGLEKVLMGIQSASPRTLKLYGRASSPDRIVEVAHLMKEFGDRIRMPRYDIILDNPWEEESDLVQTLMLLVRLPVPFELSLFSLTLYPGTKLLEKAQREGLVGADPRPTYRKSYNVTLKGLAPKLTNHRYIENLFVLVFILAKNGIAIPEDTMRLLVDQKRHHLRRLWTLFRLRHKARWLTVREMARRAWDAAASGDYKRLRLPSTYDFFLD